MKDCEIHHEKWWFNGGLMVVERWFNDGLISYN